MNKFLLYNIYIYIDIFIIRRIKRYYVIGAIYLEFICINC